MRKAIYLSCQRKQATVKSGPNYGHEHAGTSFGPSGSREQADIRKPGLAASPVRFAVTPYKNTLLSVKIGPLTVSLLGLALAVVLWGLEYKLSLYHPHANNSARVRVAKLWVGPKRAAVAQSFYTRSTARPTPELYLSTIGYLRVSCSSEDVRGSESGLVTGTFRSRRSTPRSPPTL
jgi:hypothetical protein